MASYWYWNLLYLLCAVSTVDWLVSTRATDYCSDTGRLNCSLENVNGTRLFAALPVLPDFPCIAFVNYTRNLNCCPEETTTTTTTTSTTTTTEISTRTGETTSESTTTSTTTSISGSPDIPSTTPLSTGNTTIPPPIVTSKPPVETATWKIVLIVVAVVVGGALVIIAVMYFIKHLGWFGWVNKVNADEAAAVALAEVPAGNGNETDKIPLSSPNTDGQVTTPPIPDNHTVENETGRDRAFSTGSQAGDTTVLMPKNVK